MIGEMSICPIDCGSAECEPEIEDVVAERLADNEPTWRLWVKDAMYNPGMQPSLEQSKPCVLRSNSQDAGLRP